MRQTDTHVIVDVRRNGLRTTVSLPRPIFWLDALMRPGGARATEQAIQARAAEGQDSKQLVADLGWRTFQAVETLKADLERHTGEPTPQLESKAVKPDRLTQVMRHLAQLPDDAELPGPFVPLRHSSGPAGES